MRWTSPPGCIRRSTASRKPGAVCITHWVVGLSAYSVTAFSTTRRGCATPAHSGSGRQFRGDAGDQRIEIIAGQAQLRLGGFGAIDHGTEGQVFRHDPSRTSPDACARCARRRVHRRTHAGARGGRAGCRGPRPASVPAATRRWRGSARPGGRSTAGPARRDRSSPRPQPVWRSTNAAFCGESMSPLAITGIAAAT